jgi:hypothetical protein
VLFTGVSAAHPADEEGTRERVGTARGSRFLLGVERVTGVLGWATVGTAENDFGRFERERFGGQLHVLGATSHAGDGRDAPSFSSAPRVALDFVVGAGLTLGLTATLLGSTGTETLTIDGAEQPQISFPDTLSLQGGGRVGYLIPLGATSSFWPRVGLTYSVQRVLGAAGARQTLQAYQLTLEPTFLLSPVPHVGFLIHPIVDVGIAGSSDNSFVITGLPTQKSEGSFRAHALGLMVGLVAFF